MLSRFYPLLLFSSLLGSCNKDSAEATIDFGPNGGFQYRTPQNYPNGGDDTDWQTDEAWNSHEKALFANLNLSLDGSQSGRIWAASVYPNPSISINGFSFTASTSQNTPVPTGSHLAYVIVDRNYRELQRGDLVATNRIANASFGPNTLAASGLYRIYYVSYVPGQHVSFRSHGDIKVE
jgi:hypothetical protein